MRNPLHASAYTQQLMKKTACVQGPLIRSKSTDKQLLLAAIEAVAWIRPQEAAELLVDLTDFADEDIAEAAYEALAMAEGGLDEDNDEDDDEDELLR